MCTLLKTVVFLLFYTTTGDDVLACCQREAGAPAEEQPKHVTHVPMWLHQQHLRQQHIKKSERYGKPINMGGRFSSVLGHRYTAERPRGIKTHTIRKEMTSLKLFELTLHSVGMS